MPQPVLSSLFYSSGSCRRPQPARAAQQHLGRSVGSAPRRPTRLVGSSSVSRVPQILSANLPPVHVRSTRGLAWRRAAAAISCKALHQASTAVPLPLLIVSPLLCAENGGNAQIKRAFRPSLRGFRQALEFRRESGKGCMCRKLVTTSMYTLPIPRQEMVGMLQALQGG